MHIIADLDKVNHCVQSAYNGPGPPCASKRLVLTPKKKKGRIKSQLRELHAAIIDLVALMNQPERDESTFKEADVSLDPGLYVLLSGIERFGPIGVVDLADGLGRDYTTVSRQVTKLVELGLVKRRSNSDDARIHEAMLTKKGRQAADALAAARQRISAPVLDRWSERDFSNLVQLMRRFVDDIEGLEPEKGAGRRANNTKMHRPRLG